MSSSAPSEGRAGEDPLAGFAVVIDQPVQWGDMDANGHVNNVVYFRYTENARIAYWQRIERWAHEAETGEGFVVASTECRFRRAVTWPDRLRVGARVREVGADRCTMEYRLVSEALGRTVAEGSAVMVSVNLREGGKIPFPPGLRDRIRALEEGPR